MVRVEEEPEWSGRRWKANRKGSKDLKAREVGKRKSQKS